MKPTKIRNKLIYRAHQSVLSKQLGCNLSKDLRQKYGKRSMRVIVGDTVKVMRGEYKGVDGKVKDVSTIKNGVTIEGIKKEKLKGGQIDIYIHSSNLLLTELNTGDKWRLRKLGVEKSSVSVEEKVEEKKEAEEKEIPLKEQPKQKKTKKVTAKKETPKKAQTKSTKPKQQKKTKMKRSEK